MATQCLKGLFSSFEHRIIFPTRVGKKRYAARGTYLHFYEYRCMIFW